MNISIFQYFDYRPYLKEVLASGKGGGWGKQSELAEALKCNSAYLSRVIKGIAELSLEQGYRANSYLGHTDAEAEYFLLQIQFARAGTSELKSYFKRKLEQARLENHNLGKRLKGVQKLSEKQQAKYYSAWFYAAIHVATSVPSLQTVDSLSTFFRLPKKTISDALVFLQEINVLERHGEKYKISSYQVHLGNSSDQIRQHHTNLRVKVIEAIQQETPADMHYSSIVSVSVDDVEKAKEIAVRAIEDIRSLVKTSKEETVLCYNFDLFMMG